MQAPLDHKRSIKEPSHYIWTQTALKDLEGPSTCPSRWHHQWELKEFRLEASLSMMRGSYFEYLAIGGGVGINEVTSLPKLKNGEDAISTTRIEEQAARMKASLEDTSHPDYLGLIVDDTQVVLEGDGKKGTLDIIGHFNDNPIIGKEFANRKVFADVKLTRDLYGVRPPYCYGDIDSMDLVQLEHYTNLYRLNYNEIPVVCYLVADYSPRLNFQLQAISITDEDIKSVNKRFDIAEEVRLEYEDKGWITDPSEKECEKCPLKCNNRYKI
jgi:hypothetical protein